MFILTQIIRKMLEIKIYILKLIFISWVVGHASTLLLKRVISLNNLPHLNFIRNEMLNKLIGVGIIKWILVNSPIKYFNRNLQISDIKLNLNKLNELREEMTYAEIVHLIGFVYVIVRIIVNIINDDYHITMVPLFATNIFANFYPILLQQLNKRRIDRLMKSLCNRRDKIDF